MKIIIAGSRNITDYAALCAAVKNSGFEITEVVCGMARGVDAMGLKWSFDNNIPVKRFPADWEHYGKSAGFIRNTEMGDYADALIALTNGSRGTAHMIEYAKSKGMPVFVVEYKGGLA